MDVNAQTFKYPPEMKAIFADWDADGSGQLVRACQREA